MYIRLKYTEEAIIIIKGGAIALLFCFFCGCCYAGPGLPLDEIRLPAGFRIGIYAAHVPSAREMAFSPSGILFVGSNAAGKVYAVMPGSGDSGGKIFTVASGLRLPVGVAFHDGSFYVSAVSRIIRFDDIENRVKNPPAPVLVSDDFPSDEWHGWKFIKFGPDGMLYVPVGAPCNECVPPSPIYATITRLGLPAGKPEIFASGIRNTVGFDWDPATKILWFTDNGRDYLGDNMPPDELNRAPVPGMNFGYPYVHGKDIRDPGLYIKAPAGFEFTPPEAGLGPHVAALGMRFYTGKMFPREYKNQIFIAEHGSWNRTIPIGYRIALASLDPQTRRVIRLGVFAEGWLQNGHAWGRPADVEIGPDGALYVSDDRAGVIYRIAYK